MMNIQLNPFVPLFAGGRNVQMDTINMIFTLFMRKKVLLHKFTSKKP